MSRATVSVEIIGKKVALFFLEEDGRETSFAFGRDSLYELLETLRDRQAECDVMFGGPEASN